MPYCFGIVLSSFHVNERMVSFDFGMILIIVIRSIKYTLRICLLGNSFELTVVMFERAASNSLLFIDFLGEPSGKVSDGGGDRGYVMTFSKLTATFVLCVTVNNLPRMSLCEAICFSYLF